MPVSFAPHAVTSPTWLLTPIPITKDNLGVVLDAGWITTANLCQGVPASKVSVC